MKRKIRLQRGEPGNLRLDDFEIEVETGMVVLDAIHLIQATEAPDLTIRWNSKAGKCGSCSAELNGEPKLTCMTRLSDYPEDQTLTVQPMKTFPLIKDLVTDVSWNYEVNKQITPYQRSLIHISEPTRRYAISYAAFCLKKKKTHQSFPSTHILSPDTSI